MIIMPIITIWSFLGLCLLCIIPYTKHADELRDVFNPAGIYENTKVNIFGCIILTILFNILCPAMTIYYWFRWLCTVGRKD